MLPAFSSGEISPRLYARVDLSKYHTGAALLENFFVDYRGGVNNRSGLKYIGTCPSVLRVRLIPFTFSITSTFVLEFGNLYMRVIKNGAYVLTSTVGIVGITQGSPGVFTTASPHGFVDGDQVYLQNITGMTQLNNRFGVVSFIGPNQFALKYINNSGLLINTSTYSPYAGGGTVSKVYLITTPYTDAEVTGLKFTQSASVMTLTHPNHGAAYLSRLADDNWSLSVISFGPVPAPPTGVSGAQVPVTTTANTAYYVVTSIDANGSESQASSPASSNANFSNSIVQLSWIPATGAVAYNIYKLLTPPSAPLPTTSLFGYIGQSNTNSFNDIGFTPSATLTPPQGKNPIASAGNFPVAVTYFQQRQVFGGANTNPQTIWMTKVGDYSNMDVSIVVRDDDAITGTLVSSQVNNIRHMISMPSGLIVLTGFGAWQVSGGGNQAITPANFVATPQAYQGCSDVVPIVVNYDIVYVSARGNTVRDLSYNFYVNIYTGTDISVMSSHLFDSYTVTEMAYSEAPFKLIWAVRSDGSALSLAFLKEQEVIGWSHHKTEIPGQTGSFESVASVIEGDEDAVYFVVRRNVGGNVVVNVERLATRIVSDINNSWFLDSALQYSGAATSVIRGLDHLIGHTNITVAHGTTVYSGLIVSSDGVITLPGGNTVTAAVVGIPITASFQTLRVDLGEPTQQGKRKMVNSVTMRVYNSYGLKVGGRSDNLQPWGPTALNFQGDISNSLYTGDLYLNVGGGWDPAGQFYAQQSGPFPVTILGAIPDIVLGDTAK